MEGPLGEALWPCFGAFDVTRVRAAAKEFNDAKRYEPHRIEPGQVSIDSPLFTFSFAQPEDLRLPANDLPLSQGALGGCPWPRASGPNGPEAGPASLARAGPARTRAFFPRLRRHCSMRKSFVWHGRGEIWRRPFAGVGFWGCQEKRLQSDDVQKGPAGRVDQARSGRRHDCYGSRQNWSEWESEDLQKQSLLNSGAVVEARRDMRDLERSYLTVKKRRACPEGTPPAELWTMLLHASWNLSPAGQGVGYKTKMVEPTCILALVERLLCRVRSSGTLPVAWHHSSGAPLHKSNKPGPRGDEWCTCYRPWRNIFSKR